MFFIKDLKDLDNGTTRVSIDIKVLKDLKTSLDDGRLRGTGTRATGQKGKKARGTGTRAARQIMSLFLFRSFRSCMSIAAEMHQALRSVRP